MRKSSLFSGPIKVNVGCPDIEVKKERVVMGSIEQGRYREGGD